MIVPNKHLLYMWILLQCQNLLLREWKCDSKAWWKERAPQDDDDGDEGHDLRNGTAVAKNGQPISGQLGS